jgi:hypothetical protein
VPVELYANNIDPRSYCEALINSVAAACRTGTTHAFDTLVTAANLMDWAVRICDRAVESHRRSVVVMELNSEGGMVFQ